MGEAYVDTMCDVLSVSWATVTMPPDMPEEIDTISHEIGHSLGFPHIEKEHENECLCGEKEPRKFCRLGGSFVE